MTEEIFAGLLPEMKERKTNAGNKNNKLKIRLSKNNSGFFIILNTHTKEGLFLIQTLPSLHKILVGDIIIIQHLLVDHPLRANLYYPVAYCLYELMIVR